MSRIFKPSEHSEEAYGYARTTSRYYSGRAMQTTYHQGSDVGDIGCMGCGPMGAMGALGAEGASGSGAAGAAIEAGGQVLSTIIGGAMTGAQQSDGSKKCAKLRKKAAKVKNEAKRKRLVAAAESFCQAVGAGLPAGVVDSQAAALEAQIDAEPATDNTALYAALGIGALAVLGGGAFLYSRKRK